MASDYSEVCWGPQTSQCELTQLTAQEHFPAKFLTRHTNISISMKLDASTGMSISPKPTPDFQMCLQGNYQASCTVAEVSKKKKMR
jgi:hypothetical protein